MSDSWTHSLGAALVLGCLVLGFMACQEAERHLLEQTEGSVAAVVDRPVAPPLQLEGLACEAAAKIVTLPSVKPQELPGLHHVLRLSDQIISGAEPGDEAALAALAALGIKTILSVDGKLPDIEAAKRHGLRYVHVPIQYKGMTEQELLTITKTFREAEGPFYVHCFHGQHRGPAAAAVGRLVLDGASREQALAEMRQWAGTSTKYEGLYQVIARGELPSADQTRAVTAPLPEQAALGGLAGFMVRVSRPFDALKEMAAAGWKAPTEHPDLDPVNEAAILAGLWEQGQSLEGLERRPDDFKAWMEQSVPVAQALHEALEAARASQAEADWAKATSALDALGSSCNACHKPYRDS